MILLWHIGLIISGFVIYIYDLAVRFTKPIAPITLIAS
jgi:hypothetical protein